MKRPPLATAIKTVFNLLLRGRYSMTFDQLGFSQTYIPLKKRLALLTHGVNLMTRAGITSALPPIVQLEPSNACNLRCLTCATGSGLMERPPEMMSFETYRNVIDQVKDHAILLVFWSWGEPFLNKDACRMIRYAKDCGLLVHSSSNGHFFTRKEQAREVIRSGLDSLIIAVDGLDQNTYSAYRKGGELSSVIKSIENLVAERARAGTGNPLLTFRFIVMKHNEHQVPDVRDFAANLGVDFVTFRSAVVRRRDVDLEESLAPHVSEFRQFSGNDGPRAIKRFARNGAYCHRPYANLTVLSSGDVVACENDFNADLSLGRIQEKTLREIFSTEQVKAFYKRFRDNPDNFSFCRGCEMRGARDATANIRTIALNRTSQKG